MTFALFNVNSLLSGEVSVSITCSCVLISLVFVLKSRRTQQGADFTSNYLFQIANNPLNPTIL